MSSNWGSWDETILDLGWALNPVNPLLVFLPEESHGQRSLVGYSPWGHRELDTTEGT